MMPATFDFGAGTPRLSPLQLAAVGLAHAGLLALLLTPAAVPEASIRPRTLTVSLIEPEVETPPPLPRPSSPAPAARVALPPLLAAKRPAPNPVPPVAEDVPVPQSEAAVDTPSPQPSPAPAIELPSPAPPTPPRPADYLANPAPPYPPLSRRTGEQGTVRLNVLVNPDGSVARLELTQSSGHARLDRSAIETVQARWKFEPARQGGKPVAAWVIVPIQFILRS